MFHVLVSETDKNNAVLSLRGSVQQGANQRIHSITRVSEVTNSIAAGYNPNSPRTLVVVGNDQLDAIDKAIVLQIDGPLLLTRVESGESSADVAGQLDITVSSGNNTAQASTSLTLSKYTGAINLNLTATSAQRSLKPTAEGTEAGLIPLEEFITVSGAVRNLVLTSSGSAGKKNVVQ